jgi:hypothetical protein
MAESATKTEEDVKYKEIKIKEAETSPLKITLVSLVIILLGAAIRVIYIKLNTTDSVLDLSGVILLILGNVSLTASIIGVFRRYY